MASSTRVEQVADQIQRELASLIQFETKDPRVGMVTVTGVRVSSDLEHARIYVTGMNCEPGEMVEVLNKAAGFYRRELGRRMHLRMIPALKFFYDESLERGNALSALIDEVVSRDTKAKPEEDES